MSLGVIYCVLLFSVASAQICSFQLDLEDTGADGWNGCELLVEVNGVTVGFTYPDGSHQNYATLLFGSQDTLAFNARNGDVIRVVYLPSGKYPTENLYSFHLIGSDSPSVFAGQGSETGSDDQFTASCCCVPGQVSGLRLQNQSAGYVTLNWNNAANATVYQLFRKIGARLYDTLGEFDWAPEGVDIAVESNTEYHVKISGGNSIGYGPMSTALNFHSLPVSNSCTITLTLLDAAQAGWGSGYVDVYINGAIVVHATSTSDRTEYTFQAPTETVNFSTEVSTDAFPEYYEYVIKRQHLKLFYSGWGGTGPSDLSAVLNLCSSHGLSATKENLMEHSDEVEDNSSYEEHQNLSYHLFANGDTCNYRITLNDAYGDGWYGPTGSYVTVATRATSTASWTIIASNLAVPVGGSQSTWSFSVTQPTQVRVNWYAGQDPYPTDDNYRVDLLTNGVPGNTPILSTPADPSSGNEVPVASLNFTSSCGSNALTCTSITNCPSLNRNPCQSSFNPPTCGACLSGFSATGATNANTACNDINECASSPSPCSANAQCTNTAGSYTCTCNSGFTGNGVTCTQSNPTTCSSVRLRLEWFDMTAQARDRYVRANQALFNNGGYAYFPNKHSTNAAYAHGYAPFLPWHRSFLWEWENALRGLGGEFACITQPYYDWTNPSTLSAMFTSATTNGYYTGMMKKGGALNGAFQNFVFSGNTVTRSSGLTFSMPQAWTLASSLRTSLYSNARPTIEAVHDSFHVWVGGTMNIIALSPRDPIFFLHHANVDQLWAAWEVCNGYSSYTTQSQITSQSANLWESSSPYSFTSTMPGYSIAPWSAHNIQTQYGYSYSNTFLQRAFTGGTSLQCPSTSSWFNPPSRRLLQSDGSPALRGLYVPPAEYIAQQRVIFETFKDTVLEGYDIATAVSKAVDVECSLSNNTNPYVLPQQSIAQLGLTQLCATGACINPCWKRTIGRRD